MRRQTCSVAVVPRKHLYVLLVVSEAALQSRRMLCSISNNGLARCMLCSIAAWGWGGGGVFCYIIKLNATVPQQCKLTAVIRRQPCFVAVVQKLSHLSRRMLCSISNNGLARCMLCSIAAWGWGGGGVFCYIIKLNATVPQQCKLTAVIRRQPCFVAVVQKLSHLSQKCKTCSVAMSRVLVGWCNHALHG